ncbi:hypothetical protein [Iningainema tapete]|uniref:Uncharacterized protein n=1 Tax=Iningainema tapete BLCC-T55 TaxID=2748662 RepID=A0A8J7C5L4_9CYAN|nr:hypothetical protein [Iningainema tapete]MBD2770971.1 hypothetical protein [Iningainema tapete BLCC-T55]
MPKLTIEIREDWAKCHNCKQEFMLAKDAAQDPEGYLILCPNCGYRWLPDGSFPKKHPRYQSEE